MVILIIELILLALVGRDCWLRLRIHWKINFGDGGDSVKKFKVETSGGWRQEGMNMDELVRLVRLLSQDKREGQTITFNVTAEGELDGR